VNFDPEERETEIETLANRNIGFYIVMLILNCSPFLYTNMQIYAEGFAFFMNPENVIIPIYIILGFAFVPIHYSYGSAHHLTKILMLV
jgi:hypothetical protein